jgi:hypothetical protein
MKFKSDIEVQAGLKDSSGANGSAGQVLSSNGSTVSWVNETTVASDVQNEVKAGVAINKGQAVYVTGADGTNIIVGLASNTTEATSSKTLGLLNATVAINGFADVVQIGRLAGLNTSAATVGDPVWLGTNGNLIYGLANKPYAPAHLVFIGVVTRVNSNNGEIFINVQNGFELNEIHDVDIKTNVPINGDVLGYDGTLWVNKTIAEWLGYAPADDALVVHKAGTETITGTKTFTSNVTANSFIKAGGTVDQYLKADGSVSTAMNSRVEVNFIATSGQTTFTTPYEVGQVEVYYNGSKLYPDEFVATNSTTIVLVTPATLNAQISIVKFVSSFNTTSIRTETVFTTTGGQTTFSVNYAIGQVDVFYNGSKLSPAEFTATNGTSVVLGFACAAGESVVIDSYVNQVSGAVGTANKIAKFTGAASLGDSQITDNGTSVGIATAILSEKLNLDGNMLLRSAGAIKFNRSDNLVATHLYDAGTYFALDNRNGNGFDFQSAGISKMRITQSNNVLINTTTDNGNKLQVNGVISSGISASTQGQITLYSTTASAEGNIYGRAGGGMLLNTNSNAHPIEFGGSKVYFNSNVAIGTATPLNGGGAAKWLTLEGSVYSGGVICSINGVSTGALYSESGYFNMQASTGYGIKLFSNGGEALKIDTSGRVTTPQQPSFRAYYGTNATWTLTSNATFVFNTTEYNIGSCYNISNGRFTAPVAGVYQFNFYTIVNGNYTNAAISIMKNGGAATSGYNMHFSPSVVNAWSNVVYTTSMYLNPGDYVYMINSSGFSVDFHGKDWSSFSGYLVG